MASVCSNGEYKRFDHEAGILRPEALQSKPNKAITGKMPSFVAVTVKQPIDATEATRLRQKQQQQ